MARRRRTTAGISTELLSMKKCSSASLPSKEHLVEMCCEDLDLVSDVLGIFCVQGRRRLETMERVMEHDVLGDIVFEAVR